MDITLLQQKLAQQTQLLPSQREWLERLLFQLAFNEVQQIEAPGAEGSGKSTLAMATAELFSEQYNVALLDGKVAAAQAGEQLMQQWFSQPLQPHTDLAQQVATALTTSPLLLVVDDAEQLPLTVLQQLAGLPCLLIYFSSEPLAVAPLSLTLNRLSADDAAMLLQHEALNSIELASRLAAADGNLHALLLPARPSSATAAADTPKSRIPLWAIGAGGAAVVLLLLLLWPGEDKAPKRQPVSAKPDITRPDNITATTANNDTVTGRADATTSNVAAGVNDADVGVDNLSDSGSAAPEANALPPQTETADTAALTTEAQEFAIPQPETEPVDEQMPNPPAEVADAAGDTQAAGQADNAVPAYVYQEASLLQMAKSDFAVQLAVLSSDAALTRFTTAYPELAVLSYQRQWQGKMQLVLLLAPFSSSEQAKQQMALLPAALRATGPFVKSVQAIQAEIKARQLSLQAQ
ncbi:SPOR domain-containing protein [Rheinheimera nanhaiensis]|uniref:SPOR domain-containing protein n=1 Tax=Rheinheimera nanhaiensis E407-8 TaxID=562729 RepID=I1DT19_9GAMM|nr:hypothetical protein [Rheinheimera nanhaiensis]GAB57197.1 hypothetical protein RNAN_0160 [Rheinheimera nanhaiensis E407-8]